MKLPRINKKALFPYSVTALDQNTYEELQGKEVL